MTNGRTFGKWVVRVQLKGRGERIKFVELAARYGLLYFLAGGLNIFYIWAGVHHLSAIFLTLYTIGLFGFNIVFVIHLLSCLFNANRRLFYEVKSGTSHVIT